MGMFDFILASREDRFAKRVMRRLRQRGWPHPMTYVRETFAVEVGEGDKVHLSRIFQDWLRYPLWRRRAALDAALDFVFSAPLTGSYEDLAPLLIPVVRGERDMDVFRPAGGGDGPIRRLAGPLWLMVAFDRPHSIQYVDQGQLDELGRPFEDLLARAVENLRGRPGGEFERQKAGYYLLDYSDVYATSRLLQPELFQALPFKGAPVAMAAARGVVLVADSEDPAALQAMAEFGAHVVGSDTRPIAFTPLILQDGAWAPFEPGPEAPLALQFLPVNQRIWDYGLQEEALAADLETRAEGLHVAGLDALNDGARIVTFATWTDGAPTLLPRADALVLADGEGRRLLRRWEDVEAVCGVFAQEPDLDPPRYRTGAPPDAEALRRLRETYAPPEGWPELE